MWRRFLYRSYRRLFGLRHTIRRRFTPAGRFALILFALWFLLGLDTNVAMGYQAFALLVAVLALSWLWTGARTVAQRWQRRPRFNAWRELPRFGTAGQPCVYRLRVRNLTRQRQAGWVAIEDLTDPRPTQEEFVAWTRIPIQAFSDRLDHWVGYSRWLEWLRRRQPAPVPEHALPPMVAGEETTIRITVLPTHRGRLHFTGVTMAQPDVFGLIRTLTTRSLPASLLILPKRYALPPLRLPGRQEYQPGGVEQASSVGQSDEFVSLRDYRPGDPPRQVHWRSVAKTDQLIVREYEDEFFVRHALVLDTFAQPGQERAFEEAVSVAASFVCDLHTQESLLDLLFVGAEAYCFTAGRGLGHVERLLEVLAGVTTVPNGSFETLAGLMTVHAPLVSGCVCVWLAWDEPRRQLVRRLEALQIPVMVWVVTEADAPAIDEVRVRQLRVGRIQEDLLPWEGFQR